MLTFCNVFKIAQASVKKLKNFPLSCHAWSSTHKTSFIFHLHHGSKAPLMMDKLPSLFLESLAELITPTWNTNAASPSSLRIRLIMLCTPMDLLVDGQEIGVQLQLSLEDPHASLMWSPPSQQKEEYLPAPMRRKQLPWNQHYPGHPPMPPILQSPYSCTDSKSLCEALISSNSQTFSIHNSINSVSSSIFIQWIPGHSDIPGNDLANKSAKEATTIATDTILPVSLSSPIQVIETICDAPQTHERVVLVYQHRRVSRDVKQINNRKDDVLLAHLQSGHHPSLKQYVNRLDPSQDRICPNCHLKEQDLFHRLCKCLALMTRGQRVFRNHQGSLEWLATRPGDVVAYTRKTLVNCDA